MKKYIFITLILLCSTNSFAKKDKNKNHHYPLDKISLSGLSWRSIGPSLTSGRISDLAINPDKPFEYMFLFHLVVYGKLQTGVWIIRQYLIMNLPTQLVA